MNTTPTEDQLAKLQTRSTGDYVEILQRNATRYFPELGQSEGVKVKKKWENKRSNSEVYEFRLSSSGIDKAVIVKVPFSQRVLNASIALEQDPESDRPRTAPRSDPLIKGQHEYEALRLIREYFTELDDRRFGSIRPLELLSRPHVLIMEKGPSQDLLGYLRRANRFQRRFIEFDIESAMKRSGEWLRLFHKMRPPDYARERSLCVGDFVNNCDAFWQLLVDLGEPVRSIESRRDQFTRAVETHLPDRFETCVTHGDFAPRNILVGDDSALTVFDTQAKWIAPIFEDIAHYLVAVKASGAQVSSRGMLFSKETLSQFESCFLSGYFENSIPLPVIRLFECQRLLEWWSSLIFRYRVATGLKKLFKGSRSLLWRGSLIAYVDECLNEVG